MAPLILSPTEQSALANLREKAASEPIDMQAVMTALKTTDGRDAHMARMGSLTITLPSAYAVTFSVEVGHPGGTMRHMSMSSQGEGIGPEALWMVATELGFVGSLHDCAVYPEVLAQGGIAINLVQPINISTAAGHA